MIAEAETNGFDRHAEQVLGGDRSIKKVLGLDSDPQKRAKIPFFLLPCQQANKPVSAMEKVRLVSQVGLVLRYQTCRPRGDTEGEAVCVAQVAGWSAGRSRAVLINNLPEHTQPSPVTGGGCANTAAAFLIPALT